MKILKETYMDLFYMGSRKSQDLLSKLEHGDHGRGLMMWGKEGGESEKNV